MNIKLLGTISLSAALLLSGCGGGANTNTNANANMNANRAATPTPVVVTNAAANTDPNLKPKIEEALKKAGFTEVTVDTSTPKVTLRGTVAKGKLGEVVRVAQEANGGKPVDNLVGEK
jgi:hypothetical protein